MKTHRIFCLDEIQIKLSLALLFASSFDPVCRSTGIDRALNII